MPPLLLAEFDLWSLWWFLGCGAALGVALVLLLVLLWRKGAREAEMLRMLKDSRQNEADNKELVNKMIEAVQENSDATAAMLERMRRASRVSHWSKRSAEP